MRIVKAIFCIIASVVMGVIWSLSYSIIFLTFPVWCWFGNRFREEVILRYMYWASNAMGEFADKIDDILE